MKNNIIEKIQKLMALGTSPNENEAAAAMAEAKRLIEKHNIDEAILHSDSGAEIIEVDYREYKKMPRHEFRLLLNIADINFCGVVTVRYHAIKLRRIVGTKINCAAARAMLDYAVSYLNENSKGRSSSFKNGIASGIIATLTEVQPSWGVAEACALVATKKKVTDYLSGLQSARKLPPYTNNKSEFGSGYVIGKQINLNRQITKGQKLLA